MSKPRKVRDLTIAEWSDLLERYKQTPGYKPGDAMRIENTMFTSARHFGRMTYNGDSYTYFEPVDPSQPVNPDGTPYVAWLMVREDFLKWAAKETRKGENHAKK